MEEESVHEQNLELRLELVENQERAANKFGKLAAKAKEVMQENAELKELMEKLLSEKKQLSTMKNKKNTISDVIYGKLKEGDAKEDNSKDEDDVNAANYFYINVLEDEKNAIKEELEATKKECEKLKKDNSHLKDRKFELKEVIKKLKDDLTKAKITLVEKSITEHNDIIESLKQMPEKYRRKSLIKIMSREKSQEYEDEKLLMEKDTNHDDNDDEDEEQEQTICTEESLDKKVCPSDKVKKHIKEKWVLEETDSFKRKADSEETSEDPAEKKLRGEKSESSCPLCGKQFSRRDNLKRHLSRNGTRTDSWCVARLGV